MKQLICLVICLLFLSTSALAQATETFDIATFQPPKGWNNQASENYIQFSTEDKAKAIYCLVTLFKSLPGLGSPKENFDAAWKTIVMETANPTNAPQMFPSDNKADWKVEGGYAPFTKDGEKGVVLLYTISGYGKMVNILVHTNSMEYETTVTPFLESFSFKKPEDSAQQASAGAESADSIVGVWGAGSSNQSRYAANGGASGYIKRQYTFFPNGTYEFLIKTFSYDSTQLLFTKETGTYHLSGNNLTIAPQRSFIQAWSKATVIGPDGRRSQGDDWGKLLSTQNRTLEKVTYRITKHYFSGIQEWQLVLQADKPTERDGPFSANNSFPNAWLYGSQKFPIKPPQ